MPLFTGLRVVQRSQFQICFRNFLPAKQIAISYNKSHSSMPNQEIPPKVKAEQLLDKLPGNSFISKTSVLTLATAISAFAISKEFYIFNDDSVVLISFTALCLLLYNKGGAIYSNWANGHIDRLRNLLTDVRTEHVNAVKNRIVQVEQLKNVSEVTKQLFDLSKETAQLEAEAYTLEQKVNIQNEARNVLDSWTRYESNQKQAEQAKMTISVIDAVAKTLRSDKKLQQKILEDALAQAEKILASAK